MDTGLTTIDEADIEKHRATAQIMITRIVVLEDSSGQSGTALAGTGRRFVSTVSTGSVRKTREVELSKTVAAIRPDDPADVDRPAHAAVPRAARPRGGARGRRRVRARLRPREPAGQERARAARRRRGHAPSRSFCRPRLTFRPSAFASYLLQLIDSEGEPPNDIAEPDFLFDTRAGRAEIAGRRPRPGACRRQGRRRPDDPRARLRPRRHRRAADAQGPLRRHRPFRERAYPHRRATISPSTASTSRPARSRSRW